MSDWRQIVGAAPAPAAVTLQVAPPSRPWWHIALFIGGAGALAYAFLPGVRKFARKIAKKF